MLNIYVNMRKVPFIPFFINTRNRRDNLHHDSQKLNTVKILRKTASYSFFTANLPIFTLHIFVSILCLFDYIFLCPIYRAWLFLEPMDHQGLGHTKVNRWKGALKICFYYSFSYVNLNLTFRNCQGW